MSSSHVAFSLDRTYPTTPERVYAHFTDPELMARWFCPNPDLPITCDLDVQPGGSWRVVMGEWVVGGSYVEVDPPRRVVFTFDWEHDDDPPTTVTITIAPDGAGTRMVLTHEESGPESGHEDGWRLSLARLERELSAPDGGPSTA